MAAQRPVSAATRVIGPHRGMAAPRLGERGLARGDGGRAALAGKSLGSPLRTDYDFSAMRVRPLAITSMGENVRTSEISD